MVLPSKQNLVRKVITTMIDTKLQKYKSVGKSFENSDVMSILITPATRYPMP